MSTTSTTTEKRGKSRKRPTRISPSPLQNFLKEEGGHPPPKIQNSTPKTMFSQPPFPDPPITPSSFEERPSPHDLDFLQLPPCPITTKERSDLWKLLNIELESCTRKMKNSARTVQDVTEHLHATNALKVFTRQTAARSWTNNRASQHMKREIKVHSTRHEGSKKKVEEVNSAISAFNFNMEKLEKSWAKLESAMESLRREVATCDFAPETCDARKKSRDAFVR